MANIGVDYPQNGALWYRLKGTAENDHMSSNGIYPASAPSDHKLLFYGYGGNDTIQLAGGTRNSAIHGGNGNDSIKNWSSDAFINGGKGNDYIWNKGSNVVIGIGTNIAGSATDESGNDTIDNSGSNVSINSGTGNDSIKNSGSEVTINAGAGRDTIINSGSDVVINSGGGSDYIKGFDEDDSLEGVTYDYLTVDGNDILLIGDNATVTVANGTVLERFIVNGKNISSQIPKNTYNDKDGKVIKGSSVADNITNDGANNVSIDAGKGNDTITVNGGHNVTVSGGVGNDHFYTEWGAGTAYVYTSGNDTLRGLHDSNVIVIADAWTTQTGDDNTTIINVAGKGTLTLIDCWDDWGEQISIVSSLNDVKSYKHTFNDENITTVSGGSGNDWIDNYGSRVSVNAGDGNNHIWNGEWYGDEYGAIRGHYTTLKTGKGTDFIWNAGDNVIIETGAGDDIVDNIHAKTANKIDLGAGNDSLINFAASSTISGGAGDDSIENNNDHDEHNWGDGSKVSIDAGAGSDTIDNHGSNVTITGGDGDDYIENYGSNVVEINGGAGNDSITSSGANVSINAGSGDDTIDNEGKSSKIVAGDGDDYIRNRADNATIDAGKGNDVIYNVDGDKSTINAGAGNDNVHNFGTNSIIELGAGNDSIYNYWGDNVTISGGKGNDYVYDDCVGTAYVYSAGNDSISGLDAFDTLVLGSVKVNSSVRADGNVTLKLSNKKTLTLRNYRADKVNIAKSIKGVKKVSVIRNDETNAVVKGTSKDDYIQNYSWSSNVTIAAGKGNDYIDNRAAQVSINAGADNDSINNSGDNVTILGGAGNDSISSGGFNNTITGGTGNDHISLGAVGNLIKYASGDGKDTIIGFNESDTLTVSGGSYSTQASGSDVLVKVGKGSILLKDAKGKALNINDTKTTDIITLSDGADNLNSNLEGVKIQALGGNDTVNNYASNVTIDGGKGNDLSYNYASNVTIDGGKGNDLSYNYAANVTIDGGAGNDSIYNRAGVNVVFQYKTGDGNDSIYGFNDTSTLSIAGGTYTSTKSGDNIIVTVGKGKITLQGAANLETVNIDFSKILTVTNKTSSPVTVAADVKVIDASTRTKAVKITGNKLDNEIYGGTKNDSIRGGAGADKIYGGSGNDTLWGDAGNDSLYGGAGKDTFIYKPGEGTDTIFDYESGDMLKILKTDGKDGGTFTKGTFSKGNLTLAISGGGSVIFDGVSKGDVININGTNHTITGKTFK